MAAPASTNTQAVAPGDLAYMTAVAGSATYLSNLRDARAADQAAQHHTAQGDRDALDAIAAILVAAHAAGARTANQLVTIGNNINTAVTGTGRTGGTVSTS